MLHNGVNRCCKCDTPRKARVPERAAAAWSAGLPSQAATCLFLPSFEVTCFAVSPNDSAPEPGPAELQLGKVNHFSFEPFELANWNTLKKQSSFSSFGRQRQDGILPAFVDTINSSQFEDDMSPLEDLLGRTLARRMFSQHLANCFFYRLETFSLHFGPFQTSLGHLKL